MNGRRWTERPKWEARLAARVLHQSISVVRRTGISSGGEEGQHVCNVQGVQRTVRRAIVHIKPKPHTGEGVINKQNSNYYII